MHDRCSLIFEWGGALTSKSKNAITDSVVNQPVIGKITEEGRMEKIAKMVVLLVALGMVMAMPAFARESKVVPTAKEIAEVFARVAGHLENAETFVGEEKGYDALSELEWIKFQMNSVGLKLEGTLIHELRILAYNAAMWEDLCRAEEMSKEMKNVIIQEKPHWIDQVMELNARITNAIASSETHRKKVMQLRGEEY